MRLLCEAGVCLASNRRKRHEYRVAKPSPSGLALRHRKARPNRRASVVHQDDQRVLFDLQFSQLSWLSPDLVV